MIPVAGNRLEIPVREEEYVRLLGYPRGTVLEGRARELADWARQWFDAHGRPWTYAEPARTLELSRESIRINDVSFVSPALQRMLEHAGAHTATLVAVSAGPELEQEAGRLWQAERPDEYFFLEIFGSAVVEHLVTMAGAHLCAQADADHLAVLPHYSPGYTDWLVDDQPRLLALIKAAAARSGKSSAVALDVLDSGMLRPKKSLLAVFGITRQVDRVSRLGELRPCENCAFHPCAYRRAPYRRSVITPAHASSPEPPPEPRAALDPQAKYTVNPRALKRWAADRLSIRRRADGTIAATFRYDGTTCTNSGRPLEFRYEVVLAPASDGHIIRDQRCAPAPGDSGHQSMCRYVSQPDELMAAIARERPLHGQPLQDALAWPRPSCPAGCYCDVEARDHKWGLVLETIHYALAQGATPSDKA